MFASLEFVINIQVIEIKYLIIFLDFYNAALFLFNTVFVWPYAIKRITEHYFPVRQSSGAQINRFWLSVV